MSSKRTGGSSASASASAARKKQRTATPTQVEEKEQQQQQVEEEALELVQRLEAELLSDLSPKRINHVATMLSQLNKQQLSDEEQLANALSIIQTIIRVFHLLAHEDTADVIRFSPLKKYSMGDKSDAIKCFISAQYQGHSHIHTSTCGLHYTDSQPCTSGCAHNKFHVRFCVHAGRYLVLLAVQPALLPHSAAAVLRSPTNRCIHRLYASHQ